MAQSYIPFGPVNPSVVCMTRSRGVPLRLDLLLVGYQYLVRAISAVLSPSARIGRTLSPAPRLASCLLRRGIWIWVYFLQLYHPAVELVDGEGATITNETSALAVPPPFDSIP